MSPPIDSPTARRGPADAIQAAKAVFFDFDGPLCDVFSNRPAAEVAEELKRVAKGFDVRLPAELASSSDPHEILRGLPLAGVGEYEPDQGRSLYAALEKRLAELETDAARVAEPTAHAAKLVSALHKQGKSLMVTSNNAEGAVRAYLQAVEIEGLFDHVVGRNSSDPLLMKPDPYCLNLALKLVGLPPHECLLIGDQPTDAEAARAADVPFLGYAPDAARAARLRDAHAGDVVGSLGDLQVLLPSG